MKTDWSAHIERHGHVVVVALLAQGLRLHDAKDLAQEAWTRLLEADRDGRLERIELPGLAIRQALYLLAERRRSTRRRELVPLDDEHRAPMIDAETQLAQRELLQVVAGQLANETPRAKSVVDVLLSSDELHAVHARSLGISVQRFRQVLCDVRSRLRAVVEAATR